MSIPGLTSPSQPSGDFAQNIQYQREAPDVEARRMQLMDVAAKLAGKGITGEGTGQIQIPGQKVAGFDPLQTQAFGAAKAGIQSYLPFMQQAGAATGASTAAYDPSTAYQQYMNPYQHEVISGIENQFAKMQNQASAQAGQVGAFGGARQGVQTAELGRQQAQAVGQAQAQNYGQAQQAARGDFENQMARYAGAGQQTAGLGQQMQAQIQQDVASSMAAGSVQQQRQQQIMDAGYKQKIQQAAEPYQRLGFVSDIYSKVPSTQMATTMGTSPMTNPLAQVLGGGIMGLGMYQGYQNAAGG